MIDEKVEPKTGDNATSSPLSILDLIVWTAAAGFALRIIDMIEAVGWSFETDNAIFKAAARTIFVLNFALPIAAALRLCQQWKNSDRACRHPGHWVLAVELLPATAFALFAMSTVFIDKDLPGHPSGRESAYAQSLSIVLAILGFIQVAFFLVAARQPSLWWKLFFLCYAANCLVTAACVLIVLFELYAFYAVAIGILNTSTFGCFCLLLLAVSFDERKKRDLLHWLGVLHVFVLVAVRPILQYVYIYFISKPGL